MTFDEGDGNVDRHLIGYVEIPKLYLLDEQDIKTLTGVNLAFGHVDAGRVVCDLDPALVQLERIRGIHPDIRMVLSVGGWGAGGFSEAASSEAGRELFAETAVELVERYGLDGLDVDWEYPCIGVAGIAASERDRENFTLLLAKVREVLDNRCGDGRILSIAGGGDRYYTRCTQLDRAVQYLDYVQLMSYDLRGGFTVQTGHHANLYGNRADLSGSSTDEGVKAYLEAGVPREKLIIGAAFYSRIWKKVPDVNHGLMQMAGTTGGYGPDFACLKEEYIDKNGFTRFWDDEAKAPFLFDGSSFISYDDERSVAEKIEYVKKQGLGGIMYWEHSCDTSHTLLRVMGREMGRQ